DINKQRNIIGGGINIAQRVMDCGDTGHILASKVYAEGLSEVKKEYEKLFHYLGRFEVKHGVIVEIYNVYDEKIGNQIQPQKTPKKGEVSSLPLSLHYQTPPNPNFAGRTKLLETITQWYHSEKIKIGTLIAWGGVGKSALIRKWYDTLAENKIHPDGIFWWGFYHHAEFERFLDALFEYLNQGKFDPSQIKTSWAKVDRIKELIVQGEYLIILDGLEEMQESADRFGHLIHKEFVEFLHYIADARVRGLCLITTRYPMKDLENWTEMGYESISISELDLKDAKALLKKRGISGEENVFEEVIKRYKAHALTLTSLAGYLNKYYNGDIKNAPDITFVFEDDAKRWEDIHKLFRRYTEKMSEAELTFLKLFSLFRTEVKEADFTGLFRKPINGMALNKSLIEIENLDFIDLTNGMVEWQLIYHNRERGTYTTHPLIKGYFESIFDEEEKKACHKTIYEYFGGKIAKDLPETLEKMQPLFEQVYHGCSAELYDEVFYNVYWEKIYRRKKYFIYHKLGAWETNLSLARSFFPNGNFSQMPLVSKKDAQSWLLNEAGRALLSIGKPKEAKELFIRGINMVIEDNDWKNASRGYQNLVDLQFRTGELEKGFESAKKALEMAEKTNSYRDIRDSKVWLAWILHLLSKDKEAERYFNQADELEKKISGYRLCSLGGVFYADFLVSIGRIDEALELTKTNLEICQKKIWPDDISRCHCCLAAIERMKKDHNKSETHLKEAIELARKIGVPDLEIEALLEFSRLGLDMKKHKDAISKATDALKLITRTGFKLYEPEAELILAKAYLAKGDTIQAKKLTTSAYNKAKSMHYRIVENEANNLLQKNCNLPISL
ncbi:TPA: hypothetical protein DCX16_05750, partial [bacterium]|nr:hypothetical protein [bacterium]